MIGYTDTIFALSSGALPAGVAVVRLSGPAAFDAVQRLAGDLPAARRASLKTIRNRNGCVLDKGIVVVFPGPESFTGEDCAELQVHGSKAVVSALLQTLAEIEGCRLAEHGEFTRRALENGRMDLVEVEGLADLIAAETEMQRRLAIEHSSGHVSSLYRAWADRLTRGRALIEAELDFADEDDVPGSVSERVWGDMAQVSDEIRSHLRAAAYGEIVREGLKVVIAGEPNAGKSSLMNVLARRDISIVTDMAGTTRDVLHVDLDIDGYAVRLYDTAGIRETEEVVEREGVRRALKAISEADLVLSLAEIGNEAATDFPGFSGRVISVGTKLDLHGDASGYDLCLSSVSGQGTEELLELIISDLASRTNGMSLSIPSRLRHCRLLTEALMWIDRACSEDYADLDVRAESLRLAGQSLGRITGHVDVEDLLDIIFSEFCIGK